jgi:hypothetical protein
MQASQLSQFSTLRPGIRRKCFSSADWFDLNPSVTYLSRADKHTEDRWCLSTSHTCQIAQDTDNG